MTPLWSADELLAATGGHVVRPQPASGISIDTRTLARGDLFVALRGEHSDGHAHIEAAFRQGAACVLSHAPRAVSDDPRIVHVEDTHQALIRLGGFARDCFAGRLVAVTGSVGKTTTKEMLRAALAAIGPTHAAQASHNNHWGVPLTLARLPRDAAFCVSEIGMNHAGEIAPLAAQARPDVAVITTIASSHIGHLGSLEAIAREKGSLVEGLHAGGVAVLPDGAPGVNDIARRARAVGASVLRFGTEASNADCKIKLLQLDAEGSDLQLSIAGRSIALRLAAPGRHMAMNALACLAAVHGLGGDLEVAARGLSDFRPGAGRGALHPLLEGTAWLLDESYNASSASVRAALDLLRLIPARRRIAVLGDMLELGEFAAGEHAGLIGAICDSMRDPGDLVYCCGVMMNELFDRLPPALQGGSAPDAARLAPLVAGALRPGDVVLVKGSYGSRMRDVVAALSARKAA